MPLAPVILVMILSSLVVAVMLVDSLIMPWQRLCGTINMRIGVIGPRLWKVMMCLDRRMMAVGILFVVTV